MSALIEHMPTMWVSRTDSEGYDYPEMVNDLDELKLSDADRAVVEEVLARGVDEGECAICHGAIGWVLIEFEDGGGSVPWTPLAVVGSSAVCEDCYGTEVLEPLLKHLDEAHGVDPNTVEPGDELLCAERECKPECPNFLAPQDSVRGDQSRIDAQSSDVATGRPNSEELS
jgi:hypothetical protein